MPDPVFGEKVCVYAELADSATIDLPELVEHLLALGVSKELLPERLIVVDELPRSSGGKDRQRPAPRRYSSQDGGRS